MLLTVALVASLNSSAQAGADCLLNPFHWLFGCGYGCDGGCGYGYDSRLTTYRIIDDWLGYGYLRNQEGTLGHYPGRPFGGYRPFFHGLFHPCPQPAPALAMPAPMPAPIPAPMAPIYNPCWDPCQNSCGDPCGDPCAMAPMPTVQVPVTTWRPMTVMVPQTQWVNVPQMPMSYPTSDCGGCDSCGGTMMPSQGMMPGQVIQGTMLQGMNHAAMPMTADSGCGCSGGGMMSQSAVPQTSYYSPAWSQVASANGYGYGYGNPGFGYSPNAHAYSGYSAGMMPNGAAWHPQMAWNPQMNTAWNAGPQWNGAQWTAQMSRRDSRRYASMARRYGWNETPMMAYQPSSVYGAQMAMRPWTPNTAAMVQRPYYANPMMTQTAMIPAPMMVQNQAMYSPAPAVWGTNNFAMQPAMANPMMMNGYSTGWAPSQPMMPGTTVMNPMVAGDIMGDHEVAGPSTASVPVIQNSFRGSVPVTRASISRPLQMSTSRSYPNVVR